MARKNKLRQKPRREPPRGGPDLVAKSYFDTYSEAHRRRPTPFAFPAVICSFALYHPGPFESTFEPYIERLLAFVSRDRVSRDRRDPPFNAETISKVAGQVYRYYSYTEPDNLDERLVYEFDERECDITWRLELHREYVAVTIFAGLAFAVADGSEGASGAADITTFDDVARRALRRTDGSGALTFTDWASIRAAPDRFFKALADHMDARRRELVGDLNGWAEDFKKPAFPLGWQWPIVDKPVLFANFVGWVVPWTTVPCGFTPADGPVFAGSHEMWGATEGPVLQDARARANNYLCKLRASSLGVSLFGHVRNDLVACFASHGAALFMSNLGSRIDEDRTSPGRFLLLYADVHARTLPLTPSGRTTDDVGYEFTARMSRLVGRIFDVGVLRLAALRNMARMKDFGQYLRPLENEVDELSFEPNILRNSLDTLFDQLRVQAKLLGEGPAYRSARTRYYLENLNSIADSLGVIKIPGWQTYRSFVRRRLLGSLTYLARIGERYSNLVGTLGSLSQLNIAKNVLDIQKAGERLTLLFLVYYLPSVTAEAVRHLNVLAPNLFSSPTDADQWASGLFFVMLGLVLGYWCGKLLARKKRRERRDRAIAAASDGAE